MRIIFGSVILSVSLFSVLSCAGYRERQLKKQGDLVISKIETFRKDKNKLPETLSEIGLKDTEDGPIYYKKESDTKYIIWFGTQLGESATYESDTKEWRP